MGPCKAAIIIPTKNPGSRFREVLASVRAQKAEFEFEVLVLDSGSTDGTVDMVRHCGDPRVRLHEIPPSEFGHGRTRNLGISLTHGAYAIVLTHDAVPASDGWLAALVAVADRDASIGGVFGRHLPYPGASPYTARDIETHFAQCAEYPLRRIDDAITYTRDPEYRRRLRFFSDNNALLRRTVWAGISYQDVEFAEDQLWAKEVLEAGGTIAYAHEATVYHSHDYAPLERLRRSFDEANAMYELFGDRLMRSFWHALSFFVRRTWNDLLYAAQQHFFGRRVACVALMPVDNLMRTAGYYLGGRAGRLPRRMRHWLSLDRRLLLGLDSRRNRRVTP